MSLADEYTGKLTDTASQISSQLSNPMQLRMFNEQANDIATQFHGATTQWEGQQFKAYALSTQQGTVKLASNQVALNYNNPDQIDAGLQAIDAATYQAGKINGTAATEIEANQTAMKSSALTGAIDAALQQGQATYANQLLAKYAPQMTADDILRVNGKLNSYIGTQVAASTVANVMASAGPQLSNSPLSRMVAITAQSESGNRETECQEQRGRNVQDLLNFAPRRDFTAQQPAKQPRNDYGLRHEIDARHDDQVPLAVDHAQEQRGRGEQDRRGDEQPQAAFNRARLDQSERGQEEQPARQRVKVFEPDDLRRVRDHDSLNARTVEWPSTPPR